MIDDAAGRRAVRRARRSERNRNSAAVARSRQEDGRPRHHVRDEVHQRGLDAAKRALISYRNNRHLTP
jgi:hypothetical protein